MEYVKVGVIIKTRGLDGTVKIFSTSDFREDRFAKGAKVDLYNQASDTRKTVTVKTHSIDGNLDIVRFKEINDIDEAEKYLKWEVHVPKVASELPPGFFFEADLIGLAVYGDQTVYIGKVTMIEEYGPYKTLRIKREDAPDVLVPMVEAFIEKVDLAEGKILIKIIPGLL